MKSSELVTELGFNQADEGDKLSLRPIEVSDLKAGRSSFVDTAKLLGVLREISGVNVEFIEGRVPAGTISPIQRTMALMSSIATSGPAGVALAGGLVDELQNEQQVVTYAGFYWDVIYPERYGHQNNELTEPQYNALMERLDDKLKDKNKDLKLHRGEAVVASGDGKIHSMFNSDHHRFFGFPVYVCASLQNVPSDNLECFLGAIVSIYNDMILEKKMERFEATLQQHSRGVDDVEVEPLLARTISCAY